jgi:YbgC/YbaW family acyl-CoA thioester hydrolase
VTNQHIAEIESENITSNILNWPIYNRIIQVHETDKDGVVHFSNYFKIAEESLLSGFRLLGYPFEKTEYSLAMINATANYYHPMKFSDSINAIIEHIEIQRIKLVISISFNDVNNTILAKIQFKVVIIEVNNRKAIPLPELLKSIIRQCRY